MKLNTLLAMGTAALALAARAGAQAPPASPATTRGGDTPLPARASADVPGDVAWGPAVGGLQVGLRFADGQGRLAIGQQLWMDLLVRNIGRADIALEYATGSVYIDPPARVVALNGPAPEVVGGNGQIVREFRLTLRAGDVQTIGHPYYQVLPRARFLSHAISPYPEIHVGPGAYSVQQRFAIRVGGVARDLTSGEVRLAVAEPDAGIAWGDPKDDLQLGIGYLDGLPRRRVGDVVPLLVYLRNVSNHRVTASYLENGDPLEPAVFDARGKSLPVQRVMTTSYPGTTSVTLAPGEAVVLSAPSLALRRAAEPPSTDGAALVAAPGKYTIRQQRASNYEGGTFTALSPALSSGSLPMEVAR